MVVDTWLYVFVKTYAIIYHKECSLLYGNKHQESAKGLANCLKWRGDKIVEGTNTNL